MEIELPQDFRELLKSLNDRKVKYLLIGGYAVILHGFPRFTSDLDVVISSDPQNVAKFVNAIEDFGFGETGLDAQLLVEPDCLVRLGVEPIKIEILNYLEGLNFEEAFSRRISKQVGDLEVSLISLSDLIINKTAVGRLKDQLDVEELKVRNNIE